jgi:iron complex outermembrane receptor protein
MTKFLSLSLLLFCCTQNLIAQPQDKFRLLDLQSSMPIVGATFQYAGQKGISGENGIIEFRYLTGSDMQLSHVGYGEWKISDAALRSALRSGVFYTESKNVNLYPVTVIAMHPKGEETEKLDLDYVDRMAHDGGALLTRIPALNSIRKSGSYGFDPVLRGFKYDQLNVVLNGAQCATAACPNRMDPPTSQMAPNMMDRIEVLKGPHAMRYGGAFGGTINFIPTPLRFTDRLKPYGRFSAGYDSNGDLFRSEGLLGFSNHWYDLGLYGSLSQGKDYTAGDGSTIKGNFSRHSFGANLGLKLAENQQVRLSATRNMARDVDFPALPMDLRMDDTWMLNARHDIAWRTGRLNSWNTTVFGSFVDHRMDNLRKKLDPRMVNAETTARTQNFGGRTEGEWGSNNGKLYAGLDLRIERADGTRVREFLMGQHAGKFFTDNAWQKGQIGKSGVFAEYQHITGSVRWVLSGRLEVNQADIRDADPEFRQVYPETHSLQINPGISLGGIKRFGNGTALGLWLGRAQRSGGLTERFINYFPVGLDPYEMLGNPQLDPEINNQADLTLEWKSLNTHLQADLFVAYMQDFISSLIDTTQTPNLPSSPGVRRFINLDRAVKTGFEIGWSQSLFAGLQHLLSMAYTYGQDLARGEPLPEIAPLDIRYVLSGTYLKKKLRPELAYRYVLEQSRISTAFGETPTPAFNLLDVKIFYRLHKVFGITAGVQNLFNEHYYEHLSRSVKGPIPRPIFEPGRNFFVSLNFDFM